ncbi:MAG: cysteine--tRNA ligase [bacterium]|nr:cysteine--tRNA ligase [bacterium]
MTSELRLFNTMTRRLEAFESIDEGHARLYTCGPTVYDYSHIGNLRTFLFEDILRRTLKLFGFQVTQVMNLTDIDDKTIRGANEAGKTLRDYTDAYIEAFFEDLETLRIEKAEHYPRATDYVDQMVDLVKSLEDKGHTYRSEGSIYYRISTFPEYGKLSGIKPEENLAGARVDSDEYEKEDARDFVLWKAAKEGEPSWDTDLGKGRPGWHIECSAMSSTLLGTTFDIHSGGVDNIFPHHENEIAQSEGASGQSFARFWLHAEHLVVEGEKMAKSKGNFFTLRDLIKKGFDPLTVRYLLLSVPYRQKLNFTFDGLHAAAQAVERLTNLRRRLDHNPTVDGAGKLSLQDVDSCGADFRAAMADDLNTARGVAALHNLCRLVNTALDEGGISQDAMLRIESVLGEINSVLDIVPTAAEGAGDGDTEIDDLVAARTAARAAKDFAQADTIRDKLTELGIVVEDTPHGPVWRRTK